MKKLNFNLGGIREMLTREQMKNVMGGIESEEPVEKYKCCPGPGNGTVQCSDCVIVPAGSTASCSVGTVTAC